MRQPATPRYPERRTMERVKALTQRARLAFGIATGLKVGAVRINDWQMAGSKYPSGGVRQSGLGCDVGPSGLDEPAEAKFTSADASRGTNFC